MADDALSGLTALATPERQADCLSIGRHLRKVDLHNPLTRVTMDRIDEV